MASTTAMPPDSDLLIRSASSLLSIIDRYDEPSPTGGNRTIRFLDRIALLFVTEPKDDDSAVAAVLTGTETILVRVTESPTDSASLRSPNMIAGGWLSQCCR